MENEIIDIVKPQKVVLDYKSNAINALITAFIGIGGTLFAQYLVNRAERRSEKTNNVVSLVQTDKD